MALVIINVLLSSLTWTNYKYSCYNGLISLIIIISTVVIWLHQELVMVIIYLYMCLF